LSLPDRIAKRLFGDTVPDPETGHLAGISFIEHFEVCVRVGSDNKIKLELSQLFY
jgi:hypothetical protein